ncbi:MAG TPA: FtsW/RodA/SpoVE family cell cycle protein [Candidatus Saccharimonadales bacterium]|nr:FtsW/RodA/SpoVE family cell cycle protein [Candidatus Saccharimonadales bacterium]
MSRVDRRRTGGVSEAAQFSDMTSVRRHRPDYLIVLYMGLLMLIGLIIIFAIGPQRANVLNGAYGSDYSDSYFFMKQLLSLLIAVIAFGIMAYVPYTFVTKHAGKLLLIAIGACALLAVSGWLGLGIAQESLGATRWFNFGGLSLQPAELVKFAILVFMAGFLGSKVKKGALNSMTETIQPLAYVMAIALLFIVLIQKDLGTGISLVCMVLTMLIVAKLNLRNSAIIATTVAVVGLVMIFSAPHRVERIMTYLKGDNTSVSDPEGYHIEHAKIAIGTGGLFGVGIGNSVQATGYLPEAINDSVFAIMGEIFGLVGLVTILALFVALLMRLLKVMDHLVDVRLKLLAAGVFGWFGSHVILNVGAMIGIIPLTGITLPLLSYGGTSMLFIAASLGLIFQLSHYTVHTSRLKEAQHEDLGSRRRVGRSHNPGRSGSSRT